VTIHLILAVAVLAQLGATSIPPVTAQSKAKAQALTSKGTDLYEAGDISGALEKFRAAYAIYPSPKLFFNIGQAYRDLGQPLEAREAFSRFIVEAREAPASAFAEARNALSEVAEKLGRVQVTSSLEGWAIELDDRPLGTLPLPSAVWALPGWHQISIARDAGKAEVTKIFSVSAGRTTEVILALPVQDTESSVATRPRTASAPPAAIPSPRERPLPPTVVAHSGTPPISPIVAEAPSSRQPPLPRWLPWAGAGTTVALAIAAIETGLSSNNRYDELKSTCGRTPSGCTADQIDSVRSREDITTALWVLSAFTATATGVSVYVNTRESGIAALWTF